MLGDLSVEENNMLVALRKMPDADQSALGHLINVLARTYE
jgi:hypothetical protein